jgi:hypothetical protein
MFPRCVGSFAHFFFHTQIHTSARICRYPGCVEWSEKPATWHEWQVVEVDASEKKGGTDMRPVFALKKGTRRDLLARIYKLTPVFNFHMWVHQMTAHQGKGMCACAFATTHESHEMHAHAHSGKLRNATFDPRRVIQVKSDFAATWNLKSAQHATCEFGCHTNMYVAVVLHSEEEAQSSTVRSGEERKVQCSVWRCFTNGKPSVMVHQRVMQKIASHYKQKNGLLTEMQIETDGCASQFKCRKNFFGVAGHKIPHTRTHARTHIQTHTYTHQVVVPCSH